MVEIQLDFYLSYELHHHFLVQVASVYSFYGADKTCFFVLSHKHLSKFALPQLFSKVEIGDIHMLSK